MIILIQPATVAVTFRMKQLVAMILSLTSAAFPAAPPEPRPLRVLSWNLHHGVGEDGKLDLPRIAAVIRNAKPDLVALQELDDHCGRSGNINQPAELAQLTGMQVVFGKAMDFDGGAYGQAILSRHPITRSKVHRLPGNGEPRIAFEALISVDGKPLRFITLHLDLDAARRLAQAEAVAKLSEPASPPAILCGDFNDTPGSPPLAAIARDWRTVPKKDPPLTYPAAKPNREIDHVFTKGFTPVAPLEVLAEAVASDHRPLLALLAAGR
jgi:endonuclease/exonuclease/phosphatase family metal-dependent hydrolase